MPMDISTLPLSSVPCRRYKDGLLTPGEDTVSGEIELTINADWLPGPVGHYAVNDDLEPLVVGNSIIELSAPGTPQITARDGLTFTVTTTPQAPRLATESIPQLPLASIINIMDEMLSGSERQSATGSFHRAGVYDPAAKALRFIGEDIGRHNCIDRLVGKAVTAGSPLGDTVLFITARATASLVDKAGKAGFRLMVSRSAVTTGGLHMAEKHDIALIGFVRDNRFSVFSDPHGRFTE